MSPRETAAWLLDNPAVGRGHLLTAARAMTIAHKEIHMLLGHLDAATPSAHYVELGIAEILSRLSHVVRALDVGK